MVAKQTRARAGEGAIGCPCGCATKLPWIIDPDCVRYWPVREDPVCLACGTLLDPDGTCFACGGLGFGAE